MRYCFLCLVYVNNDRKLYEIVDFNENDFLKYSIRYVNEEGLRQVFEDEETKTDFYIENGYLGWDGPQIEIPNSTYDSYLNKNLPLETCNTHMYDFLLSLINMDVRYLDNSAVEKLKQENQIPEHGVARMSTLKISKSTMRVYLSVLTEEGWRARTVVGNESGLLFEKFHFLVETEKDPGYSKHSNVNLVESLQIGVEEFNLYEVEDGFSLYPEFQSGFKLESPLLNHKLICAEKYKSAVDFLDFFISATERSLFGPKETEKYPDQQYTKKPDRSGVFLKLHGKQPAKYEYSEMVAYVVKCMKKIAEGQATLKSIVQEIKGTKYHLFHQNAILSLLFVMVKSKATPLDRLEAAREARKSLKSKSLRLELELFAIRAFVFVTDYSFPEYEPIMLLEGGITEFTGEMVKVGGL